jgi:hypothetical protein
MDRRDRAWEQVRTMRQSFGRVSLRVFFATLLAATGALGGCSSSLPDFSQFQLPNPKSFLPSNSDTYVPPASARAFRPVAPEDLVDGQGMCAGMASAAVAGQGSEAGPVAAPPPGVPGNIGLDMSECEVVRAVGQPPMVDIGKNERGERKVVMTFSGNERAGTYQFTSGRLTSLERGPEPPPPPPSEKPKKKPATAKQRPPKQHPPAPPAT